MKFYEAVKELLDGKTIRRMNYDEYYDEVLLEEISFDGKDSYSRKARVTCGLDGTRYEKILDERKIEDGITFYPEEFTADNWTIKDGSCSAEEAFKAFNEGKWIRHKTKDSFIRRDPFELDVCYRCYVNPEFAGDCVYKEPLKWEDLKYLFVFKDEWFVYDYNEDEHKEED